MIFGIPISLVVGVALAYAVLALRLPRAVERERLRREREAIAAASRDVVRPEPEPEPVDPAEAERRRQNVVAAVITAVIAVVTGVLFGRSVIAMRWRFRSGSSRARYERLKPIKPRSFAARYVYLSIAALFGVGFLILVRIANGLPVTHGSKVVMQHELLRAAALLTGVVFLLLVLGALLPLILNALERSGFARFVGARHIRATKSGFLTIISILSICGVAVSSCALGSVISIMGGFGADLKRKILANNAHIVVDTPSPVGFEEWQPVLERVRKAPNVKGATPMITGEVMASIGNSMSGVIVRGIDVGTIGDVLDLPKNIDVDSQGKPLGKLEWLDDPAAVAALSFRDRRCVEQQDDYISTSGKSGPSANLIDLSTAPSSTSPSWLPDKHEAPDPDVEKITPIEPAPAPMPSRPVYPTIVIGRELAKTLHLCLGSDVSLTTRNGEITPAGVIPRERKFRVAAIFFSGMYEYDVSHAYMSLDTARPFFDMPTAISAIEVRVDDSERADQYAPAIVAAVDRPDLRVRDWREINKNLFSALKLERIATFIVLSLAIIVASFCILCTLLLMVTEKGREIAILKALGASDLSILRVFMVEGMIIGGIGTIFGVATGYAVCYGLSWFGVRIDPDVYYIDRLPIQVSAWDFAAVTLAALLICAIATLYPARAASKLLPVEGLRYE